MRSKTEIQNKNDIYLLVVAGGLGTRLWPIATKDRPKFVLPLTKDTTILEKNIESYSSFVRPNSIFLATNKEYVKAIKRYVKNVRSWNLVEEPERKESFSGAIYSTHRIFTKNKNAIVIYSCSDVIFSDKKALCKSIMQGIKEAEKGKIVMLGVRQTERGNTEFGYIKFKKGKKGLVQEVKAFKEKPSKKNCLDFFSKQSFWQAGVLIYRADKFFEYIEEFIPRVWKQIIEFRGDISNGKSIEASYQRIRKMNINYDFLEKLPVELLTAIRVDSKWYKVCDIETYFRLIKKDRGGNYGSTKVINSKRCLVYSSSGKPIYIKNLKDILFIENKKYIVLGRLDNRTCKIRKELEDSA